jgi:hypothetical protein
MSFINFQVYMKLEILIPLSIFSGKWKTISEKWACFTFHFSLFTSTPDLAHSAPNLINSPTFRIFSILTGYYLTPWKGANRAFILNRKWCLDFRVFIYLRKIPSIFLRFCSNLLKSKHSLRKIEGIFRKLIRKPLSLWCNAPIFSKIKNQETCSLWK